MGLCGGEIRRRSLRRRASSSRRLSRRRARRRDQLAADISPPPSGHSAEGASRIRLAHHAHEACAHACLVVDVHPCSGHACEATDAVDGSPALPSWLWPATLDERRIGGTLERRLLHRLRDRRHACRVDRRAPHQTTISGAVGSKTSSYTCRRAGCTLLQLPQLKTFLESPSGWRLEEPQFSHVAIQMSNLFWIEPSCPIRPTLA